MFRSLTQALPWPETETGLCNVVVCKAFLFKRQSLNSGQGIQTKLLPQHCVLCRNVTQARLESDLDILFYIIIILLTNIVHTDYTHRVSSAVILTTSKLPGATIRLSITLLIFVTRDKMEDCVHNETAREEFLSVIRWDRLSSSQRACRRTCSAGVGLRSWFLFRRHSLKAVSSGAGFTRGKAISHW